MTWAQIGAICSAEMRRFSGGVMTERELQVFLRWVGGAVYTRCHRDGGTGAVREAMMLYLFRDRISYAPVAARDSERPSVALADPRTVDLKTAPAVVVRRGYPVWWLRVERDEGSGRLCAPAQTMGALRMSTYGRAWGVPMEVPERPPFASAQEMLRIREAERDWVVFSPGAGGWVPAFWDPRRRGWFQRFGSRLLPRDGWEARSNEETNASVRNALSDVGQTGPYGEQRGVVAPPHDRHFSGRVDLLLPHTVYKGKWLPAFRGSNGGIFLHDYPAPREVSVETVAATEGVGWRRAPAPRGEGPRKCLQ